MCLIVCAWKTNPNYPLILGTNRDEYHSRPTKKLHWWPDNPKILGGRDLYAGGTWLALNKTGHLSAVTNYHAKEKIKNNIFRPIMKDKSFPILGFGVRPQNKNCGLFNSFARSLL